MSRTHDQASWAGPGPDPGHAHRRAAPRRARVTVSRRRLPPCAAQAVRRLGQAGVGLCVVALSLCLLSACAETESTGDEVPADELGFPWDGEGQQGKTDAFGRSLVGVPSPYMPDPELLADPEAAEERLTTNMRARREQAWATARQVLEPVPLVGLANQLEARPDCADGVEVRDLEQCANQDDEATCGEVESNGVPDVCAWSPDEGRCLPACDKLSLDGEEIPKIPRWETWYGVEDITTMFKYAYGQLSDEEKVARAPFSDALIGEAMVDAHTAVERSSRWPLWRYQRAVTDLFDCELTRLPDETDDDYAQRCADARQSAFSGGSAAGGGIGRMMYSPAMVLHMMRNYGEILECRDDTLVDTWCGDGEPCVDPPENFSTCFKSEFPADAGNPWSDLDPTEVGDVAGLPDAGGTVVIKATWARVGFGFDLPAFDTDAESLSARVAPGEQALWNEDGDRVYEAPTDPNNPGFPGPDDIYTIKTRSGGVYRLTGLHIMTKELRHWQWITLWWSDSPDTDFGADRPASFDELPPVWSNYKMCAVVDYVELDTQVLDRYADLPTLQAALEAVGAEAGAPTWCSNPYIEHGPGNARTNCIGCHQHAGTRFAEDGESPFDLDAVIANELSVVDETNRFPANGRLRRRTHFASDYSWAFSRLDDLTELVRTEIEFEGQQDPRWVRINEILEADGDAAAGELVFRNATPEETCTDCHGMNGEGGVGPNLEQRFAQKTEWQLLHTIIDGRDPMPAWGDRLTDTQLADLMAYLETNFGTL